MGNSERTCKALITHYQTYPKLEIQDIFKYIYQSAFGCEHFVASVEKATEYIVKEYAEVCPKGDGAPEALDGDYCRVPLSYINKGLSANTLGKLFAASAKKEEEGMAALAEKLGLAGELVSKGQLPFAKADFDKAAAEWERAAYPSVHHSEAFRKAYRPSYRVVANRYIPFIGLFAELDKRLQEGRVIVAIEGSCGSGKTTLSSMLSELYDCTVFHMDDFFLRPEQRTPERFAEIGGNIDWERFLSEVLQPLSKGEDISFRRFDCSSRTLTEPRSITPKQLVVVEGVYSMRYELAEYYDLAVFLDISPEEQRARILRRNSPQMAQRFFTEWIPLENRYFNMAKVKERCDVIIKSYLK